MSDRKLPFDCMILDSEPVEVQNPFSGESCMLDPTEVAVYMTRLWVAKCLADMT